MTLLTKLRPGAFGLLVFGIMVSTVATSVFKGTQRTHHAPQNTSASVDHAALPQAEAETETTEQPDPEAETELTYFQYQIDVEIENLDRLIRQAARARLDSGVTTGQVQSSLAALANEPPTAESAARKLYLLRTLQTLKDDEPLPMVEVVEVPTVEDYQDVIATD